MTTPRPLGSAANGPDGWLASPGAPFRESVWLTNTGRSKVMIGPNGFGKSRLLRAIRSPGTPRGFRSLPLRLHLYAGLAQEKFSDVRMDAPALEALAEAEALRAFDHSAWADRAAEFRDPIWLVGRPLTPGVAAVELVDIPGGREASWRFAVPARQAHLVAETWTSPDEMAEMDLAELTAQAFVAWSRSILALVDGDLLPAKNALVARSPSGKSHSLLELAETFCTQVCQRTTERLHRLSGFTVEARSQPEESFAWSLRLNGNWFGIEDASTAIRRWVGLCAAETLREFGLVASDAVTPLEGTRKAEEILHGELPDVVIPFGEAQPFSTRSSWVAMDEPEVHLFGSEALQLGAALADYSRSGRLMVATHSLELASRMLGTCDFITFHSPGELSVSPPETQAVQLLGQLAQYGIGIMASTRVLYVEGNWDVQVIELLYGDELSRHNVLLSPMHGVDGASVAVSSVWQRMAHSEFGVMFDRIRQKEAEGEWEQALHAITRGERAAEVRRLRRRANDSSHGNEQSAMLKMMANVLEGNMENKVRFVMHGLSDVFQVCHPRLFHASRDSWKAEGYVPGSSFKEFCKKRYQIDLTNGAECGRLLSALKNRPTPVEESAYQALSMAIHSFITARSKPSA
jgi:hypothetical protein